MVELEWKERKVTHIYNLLGVQEMKRSNHFQIIIYEDGKIEKNIVIE